MSDDRRESKTLAGMADKLMTKEQKERADKIRASRDRNGHDEKKGLR